MNTLAESRPGELHLVIETDEIAALCLDGDFDLRNASSVAEAGERLLAGDKHVILDLSEATFIDSSVVHALFRLGSEARTRSRVVVLQFGTAPIVERMLDISGIDHMLPRVRTRKEAVDTIHKPQGPRE